MKIKRKEAFTLAEVLITLVIIGVVAAITIPILHNSTNDKQYAVGVQKARATIGEAFRMATVNGEITKNITSAKDFVDEVLAKRYLKIVKSCDNATECGFTANVKRPDGQSVPIDKDMTESTVACGATSLPNFNSTNANYSTYGIDNPITNSTYITPAYFKTLDGYSVKIFYNPLCAANWKDKPYYYNPNFTELNDILLRQFSLDVACMYGVYDMNGEKGPNTIGKDIGFVGSFYNGYQVSATAVLPYNGDRIKASEAPGTSGTDYPKRAVEYCQNLDNDGNWVLPDVDELSLIYLNKYMVLDPINDSIDEWGWTRSLLPSSSNEVRFVDFYRGGRDWRARSHSNNWILCVRNTALK